VIRASLLALGTAISIALAGLAFASEGPKIPAQEWSWQGVFGTFDQPALQRGLQVYLEVCASCHGLNYVAYRNLTALGYNDDQVKAFAAEFEVEDGPNEEGEMFFRPARPADRFVSPFPNDQAARASNNGALPPELSLIAEARQGGADYLYALLTGYVDPPDDVELPDGMTFNTYFASQQIAMPQPLYEDGVEYADGTKASVDQMARDVSTFLTWTAEPYLEERKSMGFKVILFLLVFTAMLIAVKRKVWADVM
jgi:ubiquinol-cytochrome c reductase cytochrome c1 subunit